MPRLTRKQAEDLLRQIGKDPSTEEISTIGGEPVEIIEEPTETITPQVTPPLTKWNAVKSVLGRSIGPTIVGNVTGLATAAAIANPWIGIPAALTVGGGSGLLSGMGQEEIFKKFQSVEDYNKGLETFKQAREQYPILSTAVSALPSLINFGSSMAQPLNSARILVGKGLRSLISREGTAAFSPVEKQALFSTGINLGTGAGMEAGSEKLAGEKLSPGKILTGGLANALIAGSPRDNFINRLSGFKASYATPTVTPKSGIKANTIDAKGNEVLTSPDVVEFDAELAARESMAREPLTKPLINTQEKLIEDAKIKAERDLSDKENAETLERQRLAGIDQSEVVAKPRDLYTNPDWRPGLSELMSGERQIKVKPLTRPGLSDLNPPPTRPKESISAPIADVIKPQPPKLSDLELAIKGRQLTSPEVRPAKILTPEQEAWNLAIKQKREVPPTESELAGDHIQSGFNKEKYQSEKLSATTKPNAVKRSAFQTLSKAFGIKVTPKGELSRIENGVEIPVRGIADLPNNEIFINKALEIATTLPHEISHFFVDFLKNSGRVYDRRFYQKGLSLVPEEKLVEAAAGRLNENAGVGLKQWAQDLWATIKYRMGSADETELSRLLARNILESTGNKERFAGELKPGYDAKIKYQDADVFIGKNDTLKRTLEQDESSVHIITPSAKNPGKWQRTEFWTEGGKLTPMGDSQYNSRVEAIKDIESRNYSKLTNKDEVKEVFDKVNLEADTIKYQDVTEGQNVEKINSQDTSNVEEPQSKPNLITRIFQHGAPGFTGVIDKIAKTHTDSVGQYLARKVFDPLFNERTELFGKYLNPAMDIVKTISSTERNRVMEYGAFKYEHNGEEPFSLTKKEQIVYDKLRELLVTSQQDQVIDGPLVKATEAGKVTFREAIPVDNYWPISTPELKVVQLIRETPKSPKAKKLIADYVAYNKHHFGGDEKATFNDLLDNISKFPKEGSARFMGLRKAEGSGLPPSWREQELDRLFGRYFKNFADDISYYRHIEKDPIARSILDVTDQFGKKSDVVDAMPDGEVIIPLSKDKNVEVTMRIIKGAYNPGDITIDSANRFIRSLMLQTATGAWDLITGAPLSMSYVPARSFASFISGATHIKAGIVGAKAKGVISSRSIAVFESGLDTFSTNTLQEGLSKGADIINKYTGRELEENMSRGIIFSGTKFAAANELKYYLKNDPKAIKFFKENSDLALVDRLIAEDNIEELLNTVASNMTQKVQQTYDVRDLPWWAIESRVAPFFAIAKWNIGRANNFAKHVITPASKGDFGPLLKATLGMFMGGEAVEYLKEQLLGQKGQHPEWNELTPEASWNDWAYRISALASYSGFAGINAEIIKAYEEILHKSKPQGYGMQLSSLMSNVVDLTGDASAAIQAGENPVDVIPAYIWEILKSTTQDIRIIEKYMFHNTEADKQDEKRRGYARELRVYKYTHGLPYNSLGEIRANKLGNKDIQEFKRTPNISRAGELLTQKILPEAAQLPEEFRQQRLSGLKMNSYQTLPKDVSISAPYLQYIRENFDKDHEQNLLADYLRQNAVNKYKSQMVPNVR